MPIRTPQHWKDYPCTRWHEFLSERLPESHLLVTSGHPTLLRNLFQENFSLLFACKKNIIKTNLVHSQNIRKMIWNLQRIHDVLSVYGDGNMRLVHPLDPFLHRQPKTLSFITDQNCASFLRTLFLWSKSSGKNLRGLCDFISRRCDFGIASAS